MTTAQNLAIRFTCTMLTTPRSNRRGRPPTPLSTTMAAASLLTLLLCGFPYLVYAFYMMFHCPTSPIGWMAFIGCGFYAAVLAVWVIAAMPENLQMNGGR